jgi:hypothetical protein
VYLGEATGICYDEYGACAVRVIETGIARGSLSNDNYRQYYKYVDSNGANVLWFDSTNLNSPPGNFYYGVRVQYDGSSKWEIYRTECSGPRWWQCTSPMTKIAEVSASSVGFSAGASVYVGATGESSQIPPSPLTLNANLSDMQYRTAGSGYTDWVYDNRISKNSCLYRVFSLYPPDITVDMNGSCP